MDQASDLEQAQRRFGGGTYDVACSPYLDKQHCDVADFYHLQRMGRRGGLTAQTSPGTGVMIQIASHQWLPLGDFKKGVNVKTATAFCLAINTELLVISYVD